MTDQPAGCVYVLEFSTGQIKVGRATNCTERVNQHVRGAARYGITVVNTWISPQHYGFIETERRLIGLCHELGGQVAAKEYFAGVDFASVTAEAARWSYITPEEGESARPDAERGVSMEQARKNLAFLGQAALAGQSTLVTNHGRPYFVIAPPGDAMTNLTEIDQRLASAINAGDDQALIEVADEIEQAGLPLLAQDVRTRKSAGLRELLASLLGQPEH